MKHRRPIGMLRPRQRHSLLRWLVWVTGLLLAATATVVALSMRAEGEVAERYRPSAEVEGALRMQPETMHGAFLYEWHCSRCHARSGWGSDDGSTPSVAAQYYQYLVKQIADLREASQRASSVEHRTAVRQLRGNQDIADVAAYLSTLDLNPHPRTGSGDGLRLGGERYDAFCRGCHQDSGEGHAIFFIPRIAGQHYLYILRQLDEFALLHRLNVPEQLLSIMEVLSAEDRAALADYISRLSQPEVIDRTAASRP